MLELFPKDFLIFALIVFAAFTAQAISGFGSIILSVAAGALFYPVEYILSVLVPLDVLLNLYIVIRHKKNIRHEFIFKKIAPFMGAGFIIGLAALSFLSRSLFLKALFGIFVILISIKELLVIILINKKSPSKIKEFEFSAYTAGAGFIHGIYASGGPLLVYAVSRSGLSKSEFRSTLSGVWFILNLILVIFYAASGRFSAETISVSAMLLPLILAGIYTGEKLHSVIDENSFKMVIYILLLAVGIFLLAK